MKRPQLRGGDVEDVVGQRIYEAGSVGADRGAKLRDRVAEYDVARHGIAVVEMCSIPWLEQTDVELVFRKDFEC